GQTAVFGVLSRCMSERASETLENEFTYEDGRRAWFELRIQPCPAGLVVVSVDVTARRQAEIERLDAYRQALRDLVTPVIRIRRGVLLVPLIGALDGERAAQMTETVLLHAEAEAAKVVIFDVAGVPEMGTDVAHHLLQATE